MWSVKILIQALTTCLFLLLAAGCVAREARASQFEHLPVGAKARLGRGTVEAVQYAPNGTRLAVGGSAGLWLYDQAYEVEFLLTGESPPTPPTIPQGRRNVRSVAFSPDSQTLASVSADHTELWGDGTVHLWDLATGTLQHTLQGHGLDEVWSVAFSPDGRTLASAGGDRTIRLWDVATGTHRHALQGHTGWIFHEMAFSPDGTTLASGSMDGTVLLWDVAAGTDSSSAPGTSATDAER